MAKTYRILETLWLVFFVVCLLYGIYSTVTEGFTSHAKLLLFGAFMAMILFVIRRKQRLKAEENEKSES